MACPAGNGPITHASRWLAKVPWLYLDGRTPPGAAGLPAAPLLYLRVYYVLCMYALSSIRMGGGASDGCCLGYCSPGGVSEVVVREGWGLDFWTFGYGMAGMWLTRHGGHAWSLDGVYLGRMMCGILGRLFLGGEPFVTDDYLESYSGRMAFGCGVLDGRARSVWSVVVLSQRPRQGENLDEHPPSQQPNPSRRP